MTMTPRRRRAQSHFAVLRSYFQRDAFVQAVDGNQLISIIGVMQVNSVSC